MIHLLTNLAAIIGPPESDYEMKHVNTLNPSYLLSNFSFYYSRQNLLSLERGITHKEPSLKELETWSCPCLLGRYCMGRGLYPNTSPTLTKTTDDGKLESGFCAGEKKTYGMKLTSKAHHTWWSQICNNVSFYKVTCGGYALNTT